MARASRSALRVPELIVKKREGEALAADEIHALIEGFTRGDVPDYQMSAFAMAVFFRGMTFDETVAMTLAMRDSGKVLDLAALKLPKVDKHSTGGVGDKVSICLAPIVASCGVVVPMMSGRGLGHTGGTLDKLEAIPGFRVDLSLGEVRRQLQRVGCALIGQTSDLAPADKRLYALRDVTGTVESIPLITSSILSKKLAEGIDSLVLDVKVGRGAFMKTAADARTLARSLVRVGRLAEKRVTAILTDMNAPLGMSIGNALEAREALEVLHDQGPDDLREVTFALASEMLRAAGVARSSAVAERLASDTIRSGSAIRKMRAIVEAQGGDPRVVEEPDRLRSAKSSATVRAQIDGFVRGIDPLELGHVSMALGAGRSRAEEAVDPGAGIRLHVSVGDHVRGGDPLATLHTSRRRSLPAATTRAQAAFRLGRTKPQRQSRIIEAIRR